MKHLLKNPRKSFFGLNYLAFEFLLPLLCVIYLSFAPAPESLLPSWILSVNRYLICFVSLPAYAVYAWIIVSAHFPENLSDILKLFMPLAVSVLFSLYWWPEDDLITLLLFEGLPFYLGINLILFGGLTGLTWKENKEQFHFGVLIIFLLLCSFLFTPAVLLGVRGWELSQSLSPAQNILVLTDYLASIGIVSYYNWPLLKSLFDEGAL